jgi:hypothetical protein
MMNYTIRENLSYSLCVPRTPTQLQVCRPDATHAIREETSAIGGILSEVLDG